MMIKITNKIRKGALLLKKKNTSKLCFIKTIPKGILYFKP